MRQAVHSGDEKFTYTDGKKKKERMLKGGAGGVGFFNDEGTQWCAKGYGKSGGKA